MLLLRHVERTALILILELLQTTQCHLTAQEEMAFVGVVALSGTPTELHTARPQRQ